MTTSPQRRTWTWHRDANGTVRFHRTTTAPAPVMPAMPAQFQGSTARPTSATTLGAARGSWLWEGMTR